MTSATLAYKMPYGYLNHVTRVDLFNVWVGMSGEPGDRPENRQRLARAWRNSRERQHVCACVWIDNDDMISCEVLGIGPNFARVRMTGGCDCGKVKFVKPDAFVVDRLGRVAI